MLLDQVDRRLMPARQILFALPKKYSKTLVQKKAIAEHRSFSLQNAFSVATFIQFLGFCACLATDALLLLHSLLLFFERNVFEIYVSKING
ncbi:MAG: hypothetical protein IPK35_12235 [Saprospiraceae bacterium]|jgi:hypothetical protein|nr:hypothetical protein [Saprospiraceae bacterium]